MPAAKKTNGLIYRQIPKVMAAVGAIKKGQENKFDHYKFRGIDDVYNALQPALVAHGVFPVPKLLEITQTDRKSRKGESMIHTLAKVQYTFYAEDGSFVEVVAPGEAADRSDKSANKAIAAAFKYAMFQLFCIPTEEQARDDADNATPEVADAEPQESPEPQPVQGDGGKAAAEASKALSEAKKALEKQFETWIRTEGVQDEPRPILLKIIAQELGRIVNVTLEDITKVREAIRARKYTATGELIPAPEAGEEQPPLLPQEG